MPYTTDTDIWEAPSVIICYVNEQTYPAATSHPTRNLVYSQSDPVTSSMYTTHINKALSHIKNVGGYIVMVYKCFFLYLNVVLYRIDYLFISIISKKETLPRIR